MKSAIVKNHRFEILLKLKFLNNFLSVSYMVSFGMGFDVRVRIVEDDGKVKEYGYSEELPGSQSI